VSRLILVEDLAGPSVLGRGGHAMYVLQWAHGLRRLGHRVLLLEVLDEPPAPQAVRAFEELVAQWWDPGEAAMVLASGEILAGVERELIANCAAEAAAVITLAAHYRREPWPLVGDVRPRVLIDQDPGYTQLWAQDGDPADIFGEHDLYFTVGLNVGTPRSRLPTLGFEWHPVVNPVVLDWWTGDAPVRRGRFTTALSWRDYGYLEFEGRILGPKVEEFRTLLDLPRRSGEQLELIVDLDPDDPDRAMLLDHGWLLDDPRTIASPGQYREFIRGSLAEFSCVKGGYAGTRSGWFSDRSACYLAAGRPVVLQSTGFEEVLPSGEGLLAFGTLEQAADALARVRADYTRHSAAAREIAREHLDGDRVLRALLDQIGGIA